MYIEVVAGIAFTASVWAVVALAISVWVPDKLLLTVAIPSFRIIYGMRDAVFYFYRSYVTSIQLFCL